MLSYTCENCGATVERRRGDEGRGRFCSVACGRAAQPMKSREERFWAKVQKGDGCWEWGGTRNPKGYGILVSGPRGKVRREMAHRVSWELANGGLPMGAICHKCDNPPCVRPDHLYDGSPATNARDRDTRLRNGMSRLTPDDVRLMRALRERGWTHQRVADAFRVDIKTAHAAITGKSWRQVT